MREKLFCHVPLDGSPHVAWEVHSRALGPFAIAKRFYASLEGQLSFEYEERARYATRFRRVKTNNHPIERDAGGGQQTGFGGTCRRRRRLRVGERSGPTTAKSA